MAQRPRFTIWASALGIALFQVVGTFGASENQPERRAVDAIAVVLALLGPLALARRDRWPLAAVVVATLAADVYLARGYAYGPIFVSVVVALHSAVQAGHRRATWSLAGGGYAGFVVAGLADGRSGPGLGHLALVAGWLVVVLAVSDIVRIRRDQAAERDRRRVGEQRLHLAQELHDVLAHNLSLINVQASVALHLLGDEEHATRPALAAIKAASRDSLHELRGALDVLRGGEAAPRQPAPRLDDLDALVAGVRAGGLDVQLTIEGTPAALPASVELGAYRIVQEALTNVTRHARARTVGIRIRHADWITIEVLDDGVGGRAEPGNGIIGMRERAAALGGTVEAGPRAGGGFAVVARLPGVTP